MPTKAELLAEALIDSYKTELLARREGVNGASRVFWATMRDAPEQVGTASGWVRRKIEKADAIRASLDSLRGGA